MFPWLVGAVCLLEIVLWVLLRPKPVNTFGLALGDDGYQRPRDPFSEVRQPNARRPGGNSAAVAVEEPDEDEALTLVGATK